MKNGCILFITETADCIVLCSVLLKTTVKKNNQTNKQKTLGGNASRYGKASENKASPFVYLLKKKKKRKKDTKLTARVLKK